MALIGISRYTQSGCHYLTSVTSAANTAEAQVPTASFRSRNFQSEL